MSLRAATKPTGGHRQTDKIDQEICVAVGPFSCQQLQNMSLNNGKQRIFVAGYRSAANCSCVPKAGSHS